MRLFDAHCHLQDERIVKYVDETISRAETAGVERMLCCGSGEKDWETVLSITERYPSHVVAALGVHPWYVDEQSEESINKLETLLDANKSIAVGEIGLDRAIPQPCENKQMEFFYRQLVLARRYDRPKSIHCRKAWGSLMELFRREKQLAADSVIHSYSGPVELIDELSRYGVSFSFSGSVTYSRNRRGREAVKKVPLDRLLIETDSPDIPPQGCKGSNEPADLVRVAQTVAELRETDVDSIGKLTFFNSCRLFMNSSTAD